MNLLFWKHKKDGHVIKDACKTKLPSILQSHYHPTAEEPTHHYDDSTDSILTGVLIGEMLSDNQTPAQSSADDSMSFGGFGGGDFGGGGSSDSFDTSDSGSSDSGSSYDSGSSDSGSSYDSGSSSSDY